MIRHITYRGREPRSMRTSKHQMIYNSAEDSWEFYFLDNNPKNLRDRDDDADRESKAMLTKYKAELNQRMKSKVLGVTAESAEVDDEAIKQLKDLGYLKLLPINPGIEPLGGHGNMRQIEHRQWG